MIDPNLLTKENGFEDGVVVEVDGHSLGWWAVDLFNSFGIEYLGFAAIQGSMMREFKSIRPLTGPMSIWNHAPGWAEWAVSDESGVNWFNFAEYNKLPERGQGWIRRPFWATREDTKEKQG